MLSGIQSFYQSKIRSYEITYQPEDSEPPSFEAQRNALNARVRLLREELQLLQEPGSYVGEVVKVMGKKKVLVKVQPEGKYVVDIASDNRHLHPHTDPRVLRSAPTRTPSTKCFPTKSTLSSRS